MADQLIARATAGLSAAAIAAPLPRPARRLTSGDFGVHNLLVAGDRLTVVDWEWAGWDDPARLVMGFVAHAGSEGLPPAAAAAFLGAYAAARALTAAERDRFERVGLLLDARWLATYATALTPEALAARRFAVPGFDPRAHLATTVARLTARLARTRATAGYRFPAEPAPPAAAG